LPFRVLGSLSKPGDILLAVDQPVILCDEKLRGVGEEDARVLEVLLELVALTVRRDRIVPLAIEPIPLPNLSRRYLYRLPFKLPEL
jgi:hypothetical protein